MSEIRSPEWGQSGVGQIEQTLSLAGGVNSPPSPPSPNDPGLDFPIIAKGKCRKCMIVAAVVAALLLLFFFLKE